MVGCQPALALQGAGGNVSKGPPVWEMQTRAQPQTLSALHQKIMVIFAIATAALVRGSHRKRSSSHLPNKLENSSAKLNKPMFCQVLHPYHTPTQKSSHSHRNYIQQQLLVKHEKNQWLHSQSPQTVCEQRESPTQQGQKLPWTPQLCHRSWDKHQPATRADKGEPGDAAGPIALPRAMQWANVR